MSDLLDDAEEIAPEALSLIQRQRAAIQTAHNEIKAMRRNRFFFIFWFGKAR